MQFQTYLWTGRKGELESFRSQPRSCFDSESVSHESVQPLANWCSADKHRRSRFPDSLCRITMPFVKVFTDSIHSLSVF